MQTPDTFVLSDGHTTLAEALEVADECHEYAEECANDCNDEYAATFSKAGAILQMLIAAIRPSVCSGDVLAELHQKDMDELHTEKHGTNGLHKSSPR